MDAVNCAKPAEPLQEMRRQFTIYHYVPRKSWYSYGQPWKDEKSSQSWINLVDAVVWHTSSVQTEFKTRKHSQFFIAMQRFAFIKNDCTKP